MIVCQIYASPRREGMYLYVDKGEDLERVPEALLLEFGPPRPAFVLKLSADRRLARVDAATVLTQITERGYYLQLPPPEYETRD